MVEQGYYIHCNIAGHGKINVESSGRTLKFKLVEMSAEGMRIRTTEALGIGQTVRCDIRIESAVLEVKIKATGRIKSTIKAENITALEYEIEFLNLPEEDKEAINQLLLDTCS